MLTLHRLVNLAYMASSETEKKEVVEFTHIWMDYLDLPLKDLQLSKIAESRSITTLGELIHWAELMTEDFQYWEDAEAIRSFGKTWRDLQDLRLEDLQLSRVPEPDADDTKYMDAKLKLSSAYGQMFS